MCKRAANLDQFNLNQFSVCTVNPVYKWIRLFTRNQISLSQFLIRIIKGPA